MARINYLLSSLLLSILVACSASPQNATQEASDKNGTRNATITNGKKDTGHKQVVVVLCGNAFCTGTLVGDKTVVTAAHCIEANECLIGSDYSKDAEVIMGQPIVHPDWDKDLIINDIAIIKLESAPKTIEKAPLNAKKPEVGDMLTLVGYGQTSSYDEQIGVKNVTQTKITKVKDTQFVFGGSKSTCHGDSGGPAFIVIDEREVLAGVTSFGRDPCGVYPATDTRVDAFRDWVIKTAKDEGIELLPAAEKTEEAPLIASAAEAI